MDFGNLISGSSAFSKFSLNIWNFMVHVLLKPGLENFEHYFASNCAVVWTFFDIAFEIGINTCFSSFQSLSHVWLFAVPWIVAHQASLSSLHITNSWSLPKPMSIESVMPSSHLILCRPILLPPILPSIRVFSNESALHIRWPKHWSFSFSISPSNEHPRLISFRMDWLDLLAVQGTLRVLSNTTVQKHQFFGAQLSL